MANLLFCVVLSSEQIVSQKFPSGVRSDDLSLEHFPRTDLEEAAACVRAKRCACCSRFSFFFFFYLPMALF